VKFKSVLTEHLRRSSQWEPAPISLTLKDTTHKEISGTVSNGLQPLTESDVLFSANKARSLYTPPTKVKKAITREESLPKKALNFQAKAEPRHPGYQAATTSINQLSSRPNASASMALLRCLRPTWRQHPFLIVEQLGYCVQQARTANTKKQ